MAPYSDFLAPFGSPSRELLQPTGASKKCTCHRRIITYHGRKGGWEPQETQTLRKGWDINEDNPLLEMGLAGRRGRDGYNAGIWRRRTEWQAHPTRASKSASSPTQGATASQVAEVVKSHPRPRQCRWCTWVCLGRLDTMRSMCRWKRVTKQACFGPRTVVTSNIASTESGH